MMSRFAPAGVCLLIAFALLTRAAGAGEPRSPAQSAWNESDSWAFSAPHDAFTDNALLDLRWLNESSSGQHGFVRLSASGDSFVDGRGKPLRFWAVGSEIYRRTPEEMDRHCRFLAKLGVNLVRLHVTVADTREGAAFGDVNQQVIDGVFRFIQSAKQNGIYLIISPYYAHHDTPKSWGLAGYSETGDQPWGAIFIDPQMQQAYKEWTRRLYSDVNPHTQLAIKDDPTVAILQILNEDSLFFWTTQHLPRELAEQLRGQYAVWLTKRYGSVAQALDAWAGATHPDDDPSADLAGLYDTYQMTLDHRGAQAKRMRDQVQFLAEVQRGFYEAMGRYLREELGCKQLLNATNWRTANDERLKAVERWTYRALEIDAENEYYGSDYQHIGTNDSYRIDPGHFLVNESCLHKPLELTTNFVCGAGRPFIVTETSWKRPNLYQSEGPFLISAYQALSGVDAVCWFVATDPIWCEDPRRLFWPVDDSYALQKWTCSTPMLMGMFPAAALSYRRGDLEEGPVVGHEIRTFHSIVERKRAQLDDNELYGLNRARDELRSTTRDDGRPSRAAYLVGRLTYDVRSAGDDELQLNEPNFANCLLADQHAIRSATGQHLWNYVQGYCTVDSPKTQGVAGFLKAGGGSFALSDVEIESDNAYAAVSVVSLDNRPIANSHRILVQVGTMERLTGWKTAPHEIEFKDHMIQGLKIVDGGQPPLRIAKAHVKLEVRNPGLQECVVLDTAGYPRETIPLSNHDGAVRIAFPSDALYVVLRRAGDDLQTSTR